MSFSESIIDTCRPYGLVNRSYGLVNRTYVLANRPYGSDGSVNRPYHIFAIKYRIFVSLI